MLLLLAGYPGGLKEITAKELWRRDPTEILRRTVYGMLPKNNLRDDRMRKLRIFPGPEHAFKGVELVPWKMPPRKLQDKGLGWLVPEGFEPMNPEAYIRRMRGSKLLVQQQHPQLEAAGSSSVPAATPPNSSSIGFKDLLTAEELEFVRSSQQRSAGP